jgi:RNAse (barnase) inhibitor barstar
LIAADGVIQFNEYGNYIEFFKQKEITKFFPLNKRFVYYKNSSFYLLENNMSFPILLEYKKTMKNIYVNNTSIYIYDGSDIHKLKFL